MPNRGLAGAVALMLATTVAPAAELTVGQVKAKYLSMFDVQTLKVDGRTFFAMNVKDLAESDVLAGFVSENKALLHYILIHGSECGRTVAKKGRPTGSPGGCLESLARDRGFDDAMLPLLARYLGARGIVLAGYRLPVKREEIDLDDAMNVAARFFYPDEIKKEDGSIQAHVCVGINGLGDLQRPRDLMLEAFAHAAINGEMRKEKSRMRQDFVDELQSLSDLDLSSDPKVRLTRAQGAVWAHMARSRPLRRVLLAEYDRIGNDLPFVLIEDTRR